MHRNLLVDTTKVLLAMMVVGIHSALFTDVPGPASHLLVEGAFRIAVPIFFVFNGYYLADGIQNQKNIYSLTRKILLLYVFWMLVYSPFYAYVAGETPLIMVRRLVRTLLVGYFHLWYLIAMVYAMLLLRLMRNWSRSRLTLTALALFGVGTALQYLNYYGNLNLPVWLYRNGIFFGLPFMLAGYLIRTDKNRYPATQVGLALVAGLSVLLAESVLSNTYGRVGHGVDMYLSLIVTAPATAMLLLRFSNTINSDHLSKLSGGVYFIHPLMMSLVFYFSKNALPSWVVFLSTTLLCLVAFFPLYFLSKRRSFIL